MKNISDGHKEKNFSFVREKPTGSLQARRRLELLFARRACGWSRREVLALYAEGQ
jgi:hypothetical protein